MKNIELIILNKNLIKVNTYVIKVGNRCVIIDPNNCDEIMPALNGCEVDYIFLTHEHFDHIMAVDALRGRYNAKVVAHKIASKNLQLPSKNLSRFSHFILDFMKVDKKDSIDDIFINRADIEFDESLSIFWQELDFRFYHTPGHTDGSSCIVLDDWLFAGDSLFRDVSTSFIGGAKSKKKYFEKTLEFFKSLDKNMRVFAGHHDSFLLKDAYVFSGLA